MTFAVQMIGVIVVLVLVHELGHFATAKFFKIHVLQFSIGFPPRLLAFRKGETLYTLNIIPLGGYVKLAGEDDPSEPNSLASKPPHIRAIVLSAGSFMNMVLAIVLFTILFMIPKGVFVGDVVIQDVRLGSPAEQSGLEIGDRITSINNHTIDNIPDIQMHIMNNLGDTISMTAIRNAVTKQFSITPRRTPPSGEGHVGIELHLESPILVNRSYSFFDAFLKSFVQIWQVIYITWDSLTHWALGESSFPGVGPIGIVTTTHEVVDSNGILALIPLTGLLSISLAIFNILPIPALDGGRLLFVMIEWIRRGKRVPPDKEGLVHMLGFALLIFMVLMVSYNDISRLINGESFIR